MGWEWKWKWNKKQIHATALSNGDGLRKSKGVKANLWYCLNKGDGLGKGGGIKSGLGGVMEQRRIRILP
jgi:hypothetical protein